VIKNLYRAGSSLRSLLHFGAPNWANEGNLHEDWEARVITMADEIKVPGTVADFGCGKMRLKHALDNRRNSYIPLDFISRSDDTIVFDVNRDPLPKLNASVYFLSGFLEYVINPQAFLEEITIGNHSQIILSYVSRELRPNYIDRRRMGWVNNLYISDIIKIAIQRFTLNSLFEHSGNHIMSFTRKPS